MDEIHYNSPIGILVITASNDGLTGINYSVEGQSDELSPAQEITPSNPHLGNAVRELDLYFKGKLDTFSSNLAPEGTLFQLRVWNELSKLPYGITASYGDIAERIGNPGASQAVGMANNRNPISIIVPCHRVIGRDGKLIGYGGGIWRKEWLLRHEGILL